jgi:hypothetical protein
MPANRMVPARVRVLLDALDGWNPETSVAPAKGRPGAATAQPGKTTRRQKKPA